MSTLRPNQEEIITKTRVAMSRGVKKILIQAATGFGKTVLASHMLGTAAEKGLDSLFVCHRREILIQSSMAFEREGISHGYIAAGFPENLRLRTQLCSIQTLAKRVGRIRQPRLIVWDECQHQAAGSWRKVYSMFPDAYHIGLTACPERLDGKGLGDFFDEMIQGPPVAQLIQEGHLSKFKLYAPPGVNTDGLHKRMGDFIPSELVERVDKPSITGDAIKEYKKLSLGKRAIVRAVSIEHSKHVASQFTANGIPTLHVDGDTSTEDRDRAMARFKAGEVLVLTQVSLYDEGVDVPAVETVIDLRPTASLSLWLQFCGRVLRPYPGKIATIIDHAGNCFRNGLPDDVREWSLEGRDTKKRADAGKSIRTCPRCFAVRFIGPLACQNCGYVFEVEARKVEQVEGELVEVDVEKLRMIRKEEQRGARTLEDLVELGRKRGYKNPVKWAEFYYAGRKAKFNRIRGAM